MFDYKVIYTPGEYLRVCKTCSITGQDYSLRVKEGAFASWKAGELIQSAFPNLTSAECEFLITGMTPAEQDAFYGQFSDD